MIIFDVGANIGDYAKYILQVNPNVKIFCFEPVVNTYNVLISNLASEIKSDKVKCNNFGFSNEVMESEMFIYEELDGRNSLHFNHLHKFNPNSFHKEKIKLNTLARYVAENNISKIDHLKLDVEGHETKVIEGAKDLTKKHIIRCIQFEYNDNWIEPGYTLENVFNMLSQFGYRFYRLAIWGKIPIRRFNKKLENYKHANYVAIFPGK